MAAQDTVSGLSTVDLRSLTEGSTPIVSVYLRLASDPSPMGHEVSLRWQALRATLEANGASAADLDAIEARVVTAPVVDRTLVAFARDGRLQLVAELEDFVGVVDRDVASVDPLPRLVPLIRWQQQQVPYVVARVDRTGADLAAYDAVGGVVAEKVVTGPDDEIERNAPGGWSQGRYQHRAEDSWAHNAAVVATEVSRLVNEVDAQLVITTGDVRATQLLTEHLPKRIQELQRIAPSGVEQVAPGRPALRPDAIRALVHQAAAAQRAATLRALEEAGNAHAVRGIAETLDSLNSSAVGHLVLVDQPDDERTAWVESDQIRLVADDALSQPPTPTQRVSLRDAIVRSAFAQGARVTVVGPGESDIPDGIAALIRF